MVVSHSLRNAARRSTTYFLASSKLANTRLPLMRLHGRQAVTRFSESLFPLRARGKTKSTVMIKEFSKLVRPSNPQYWQRYRSRSKIFSPSSPVNGLARRLSPRNPKFAGIRHLHHKSVRAHYAPDRSAKEAAGKAVHLKFEDVVRIGQMRHVEALDWQARIGDVGVGVHGCLSVSNSGAGAVDRWKTGTRRKIPVFRKAGSGGLKFTTTVLCLSVL
jgi:hypothetical protein